MTNTGNQAVSTDVLIVGVGFSGLGMARALKERGYDFVILAKENEVGGTWNRNTYPGLCCDIPTALYCYEDVPFMGSDRYYASGPEIKQYLVDFTESNNLREYIVFNTEVNRARWDEDEFRWHVHTTDGREYVARILISGAGALHIAKKPTIKGEDDFAGAMFHSAEWDDSVELAGKRVAVVGTGASAIQIVPELVGRLNVAHMSLFQRTPPWVLPFGNPKYSKWYRKLLKTKAGGPARRAERSYWYGYQEALGVALTKQTWMLRFLERMGKRNIAKAIKDPVTRDKLTPKYTIGGKRIGKSKRYYRAIADPRSALVTDSIVRMVPEGIVTVDASGNEQTHEFDVIIWATGFEVVDSYKYLKLYGLGGEDLVERADREGLKAFKGSMFPGVPNLFILLGPNTGLGHNSVVLMIEAQIKWVLQVIKYLDSLKGVSALMPNKAVAEVHNEELQAALKGSVWDQVDNWYRDPVHGIIPTLWPWSVGAYRKMMEKVDPKDFDFIATP